MVETASRLFQRDGYSGTSWRGLVEEAGTPWGSVHHHFPGGKEELGVAAIRFGGEAVAGLIAHCFDSQPDPASAVRESFRLSAAEMEASGYTAACPVASVALETVPGSEPMGRGRRRSVHRLGEADRPPPPRHRDQEAPRPRARPPDPDDVRGRPGPLPDRALDRAA